MNTKLLRSKVLQLAIAGRLVPQDPNDEPASELLKRINPKFTPQPTDSPLPPGWTACTLEDIVDYEQPQAYIVESTDYNDNYETPVLTAGKSFIKGYTKETSGIYNNLPCIIFDDFTTDSRYIDFPFKVKSSAMKILRVHAFSTKYVALFMSITRLIGDTHKRYWISEYSKLSIPLPPLAEQERIVKEVERWFACIEQLERSREALGKAARQTKRTLLSLAISGRLVPQDPNDEPAIELLKRINPKAAPITEKVPFSIPDSWCWTTLGEIGKWQSGSTPSRTRSDYYGGNIPWLKTGDLNDGFIKKIPENITQKALEETSVKLNPAGSVLIAMYGATVGKIGILTFPATTNQACCACSQYKVEQMYLFYFLLANRANFIANGVGGAQPNISKEKIVATPFPLPPLAEQERIVGKVEELFAVLDALQ